MRSGGVQPADLVSRVLEAFAAQTGLSLYVLDRETGQVIAEVAAHSGCRWVADAAGRRLASGHPPGAVQLVDDLPGLKYFLSPIDVSGKPEAFLAAGVVMEAGSREIVSDYLASAGRRADEIEEMLSRTREINAADKRTLTEQIKALARTLSVLFDRERMIREDMDLLEGLAKLSGQTNDGYGVGELLQSLMALVHGFDFIGFAEAGREECTVIHMAGNPLGASLVGTTWMIGEGFIGQAAASGSEAVWQDIRLDPRALPFHRIGLAVESLVCCPVLRDERVEGVLFAGAAEGGISRHSASLAMIFANFVHQLRMHNERMSMLTKQTQRITALKEILHLLTRIGDSEKIAYMLVDMSLNLMNGRFSAITLFDPDDSPGEVRIVSRGLSGKECDRYGKLLLEEYGAHRHGGETWRPMAAVTRETEWGTVLECPIMLDRLFGILSVSADGADEEAGSILASLAAAGALALRGRRGRPQDLRERIGELHDIAAALNPEMGQFATQLRDEAVAFGHYLELPEPQQERLAQAALLIGYPSGLVRRLVPADEMICTILADARSIMDGSGEPAPEEERNFSLEGKILGLAARYLQAGGNLSRVCWNRASDLFSKFEAHKRTGIIQDRHIPLDVRPQPEFDQLSRREQEVFLLLVEGKNNREIADTLFISEHTVKNHVTNIFGKLGIRDRAEAMAYYYKLNR